LKLFFTGFFVYVCVYDYCVKDAIRSRVVVGFLDLEIFVVEAFIVDINLGLEINARINNRPTTLRLLRSKLLALNWRYIQHLFEVLVMLISTPLVGLILLDRKLFLRRSQFKDFVEDVPGEFI
jgi:hypothetical protein